MKAPRVAGLATCLRLLVGSRFGPEKFMLQKAPASDARDSRILSTLLFCVSPKWPREAAQARLLHIDTHKVRRAVANTTAYLIDLVVKRRRVCAAFAGH